MLLDTFHGRLRLVGTMTTQSALHIGAGSGSDPLATDAPVVRTAGGDPYIPGSSLKGVLRSAAEALFRGRPPATGDSAARLWSCDPISKNRACVTHEKAKATRERLAAESKVRVEDLDGRSVATALWEETCSVCRVFGSLALASRVRFADLPLRGEAPMFELRNGVGIDRDKEVAADKVLYDFEAVPPGTAFELRVTFDNPTDPEIGLLLYLFEELDRGNLTLGGKTSRGLGRVRVRWESIEETTLARDNPFASLLSSRDLLAPAATATAGAATDASTSLPATGDPETWRTLTDLLRGMQEIDKGVLGDRAAKLGLTKSTLNQQLSLGLEGRHVRRAWDVAIDKLAASGFLTKEGERWLLAERAPAAAAARLPAEAERPRALQEVVDRYVGAMARAWEETG